MRAVVEKVVPAAESSFHYLVRDDPAFDFHWHFHAELELTFISQGRGKRFVGDQISDYAAGELVLLGPNLPHTWYSGPPQPDARQQATVVQFAPDFLGEAFWAAPEMRLIARLLERAGQGLEFAGPSRRAACERLRQMQNDSGPTRLLRLLNILEILSRCRQTRTLASGPCSPPRRADQQRRIDQVCTYINEHFAREITQPEVAALVEMAPAAFSRFFKRTTGKSFVDYINTLRVAHACRLLVETDLPVTAICYEAGFGNVSNFNRQFLRLKRFSPRAFRQQFTAPAGGGLA